MNRWITKPTLLVISLFCGCELVVRVFFERSMSGRFEYGYNPASGFEEKKDGTVHLVRAGGRRFHPQSFSKARPADTFRIMVIGDSVPRGSSLASSYPVLIGQKLRAAGIKAESFNLAVGGNGALRSQIVLRTALDYQPSLMILHVNNSNEYEDERDFKRAESFKSWHPRDWLMKSLLLRRLHEMKTERVFWLWLPEEIRRQKKVNDADAEVLASLNEAKLREWDERVKRFTSESVELCRARGIPVLLISQTRLERAANQPPRLDDHGLDNLVRPLIGKGVYHLSMKQILEGMDFAPLFADGAHLRPPGHERIAAASVEKVLQEGLVAAR